MKSRFSWAGRRKWSLHILYSGSVALLTHTYTSLIYVCFSWGAKLPQSGYKLSRKQAGVWYQITTSCRLSTSWNNCPETLFGKNKQIVLNAVAGGLEKINVFVCAFIWIAKGILPKISRPRYHILTNRHSFHSLSLFMTYCFGYVTHLLPTKYIKTSHPR